MNLSFLKRDTPKRVVLIVVALAALAGAVTGREKPAIELVEAKAPRASAAQAVVADIDLDKLARAESSLPQNDPFARRDFRPPQQPLAAAPPLPAPPAVPPLPFRYFGKVIENGTQEVFVMRDHDLISIVPGQKLGGDYRVEHITEESISFTYLPLNMRQSMELPR
jgi:hypothetical protein